MGMGASRYAHETTVKDLGEVEEQEKAKGKPKREIKTTLKRDTTETTIAPALPYSVSPKHPLSYAKAAAAASPRTVTSTTPTPHGTTFQADEMEPGGAGAMGVDNAAHLLSCPGVADGKGRKWEQIWEDPEWCEKLAGAVRG
ncbi:hypothetical protein EV426DRAFT_704452 [Tirmania nivea]|nr:hypothetical protein EV426DRAFT_704452 [Tirmania nivea]